LQNLTTTLIFRQCTSIRVDFYNTADVLAYTVTYKVIRESYNLI